MVCRRISLKYSRAGRGDLWLALGLDTRSLGSPWVWFGTLTKAIRQRHNGGHKSSSHAPKPRSWGPYAAVHASQPSIIIHPRVHTTTYASVCTLTLRDIRDFIRHISFSLGMP